MFVMCLSCFFPTAGRGKKSFSMEICPSLLLSSLQTAGSLPLHKQLGLMSSDLTLMTESASVPAGGEGGRKHDEKSC